MKVMQAIESIGITGITLVTELLTCDEVGSRRVSESINQGEKFNAIIQLGLAESRKSISLERWAHNESNFRIADNSGRLVNEIVIEGAPSKYETTASKHILDEEFEGEEDVVWSESAGQFVCNETIFWTVKSRDSVAENIPAILNKASNPKVRASSGTIGTMYLLRDLSLSRTERILTKDIVVDWLRLPPLFVNESKLVSGGGAIFSHSLKRSGSGPPNSCRRAFKY